MGTRPESDLKTLLTNAGVTGQIYTGAVVDDPDVAIFMMPTGGPAPESFFNDSEQHFFRRIQVRIRDNSYGDGRDKCMEVADALRNARPSGYVAIRIQGSDFSYIGRDDKSRHEFTLNVIAEIIE